MSARRIAAPGTEMPAAADPVFRGYQAELANWHARVEVLVTSLCMGRTGPGSITPGVSFYAFEVSKDPSWLGEPEERTLPDGRRVMVRPRRMRFPQSRIDEIARQADAARDEMIQQTGIAGDRWPRLAHAIMARGDLIGWLVAKRLLPKPPEKPKRQSRASVSEEERQANAEATAKELVP